MKQLIKSMGRRILNTVAHSLGYENIPQQKIDLLGKNNLLENFFTILKRINFIPKHIVDVGANRGGWTRETLKYFPDAYYTLFEPQSHLKAYISDLLKLNTKIKFNAVGVGSKPGVFKFTMVDRDDSCSFSYSEKEAQSLGFKQIEIPVITLNEFLADSDLPQPDIIKIDAEGLDLEVLDGGNNYFGKTEIFMVEASVVNKSFDNSILKTMVFMDNNGYKLFDLTDLNRTQKDNALWLMELVFIKKNGIIDNSINSYN